MNDRSADYIEERVLCFSEIQGDSWKRKNVFKILEILDIINPESKKKSDYRE